MTNYNALSNVRPHQPYTHMKAPDRKPSTYISKLNFSQSLPGWWPLNMSVFFVNTTCTWCTYWDKTSKSFNGSSFGKQTYIVVKINSQKFCIEGFLVSLIKWRTTFENVVSRYTSIFYSLPDKLSFLYTCTNN